MNTQLQTINVENTAITPSKVVCVGRNYVAHIEELGNAVPDKPVIFLKPNSAISQILTVGSDEVNHYETELSFIVKQGKLAAVGVGLDLTKRSLQSELKKKSLPWERAKAYDGSALFSDFVSLPQNIENLSFTLAVDGQVRQQGDYHLMLYKPEDLLSNIQEFMSFADGDILMTGTPSGVGEVKAGQEFVVQLYSNQTLLLETSWQVAK